MLTKKTILVIGAGHRGSEIADRLSHANVSLLFCDREHTKAKALVKDLKNRRGCCKAEAMECSFQSAWEADIIILAMNFQSQREVVEIIKEVVNQKILVSTMAAGEQIDAAYPAKARQAELQGLLPHTKILVFQSGGKLLLDNNAITNNSIFDTTFFENSHSN